MLRLRPLDLHFSSRLLFLLQPGLLPKKRLRKKLFLLGRLSYLLFTNLSTESTDINQHCEEMHNPNSVNCSPHPQQLALSLRSQKTTNYHLHLADRNLLKTCSICVLSVMRYITKACTIWRVPQTQLYLPKWART